MSVRKGDRDISPTQHIETAGEIVDTVKIFASKIAPDKYNIFGLDIVESGSRLYQYICEAEGFGNFGETRLRLKREALLRARAELDVLDALISRVLLIIKRHPEMSLIKASSGAPLSPYDAIRKVSKLSITVGGLINSEKIYIDNALQKCDNSLDRYRRARYK